VAGAQLHFSSLQRLLGSLTASEAAGCGGVYLADPPRLQDDSSNLEIPRQYAPAAHQVDDELQLLSLLQALACHHACTFISTHTWARVQSSEFRGVRLRAAADAAWSRLVDHELACRAACSQAYLICAQAACSTHPCISPRLPSDTHVSDTPDSMAS